MFVDGCFWHSCPEHETHSVTNRDWWAGKLTRNSERDRDTDRRLTELGWTSLRIWEHQDSFQAADQVESALSEAAMLSAVLCRRAMAWDRLGSDE